MGSRLKIRNVAVLLLMWMLILPWQKTSAQEEGFKVSGTVYSAETKRPLRDINITVSDTKAEPVSTDSLGRFTLPVPARNCQIIISFPGYQTRTIYTDGRSQIDIWLAASDANSFYKKVPLITRDLPVRDISGSVSVLRNFEGIKSSCQSADQIMHGRMAGLQAISRSGMPGEGAYMHLHGYQSFFSSNQPLLVVDGMVIKPEGYPLSVISGHYCNPLSNIDPQNISSITLLKDASETGIYGIRGGHGVLIINTSAPQSGKTTLDVSVSGGLATFNRRIPLMSAGPYQSYIMQQMYDAGMSYSEIIEKYPFLEFNKDYLYYERYNNNTNWQNEIFRTGMLSNAQLLVRGGDSRAMYSLSGGYLNHEGIVDGTRFNRINFRFNSLVNVSARFNIGLNLGLTSNKYRLMETGPVYQTNPIYASLIKAPNLAVYEQDQKGINLPVTEDKDIFGFSNPYALVKEVSATDAGISFLGLAYFKYSPSEHVSFKSSFGINRDKNNEDLFIPAWGVAPQGNGSAERSIKSSSNQYISLFNESYASYTNTFNFIHEVAVDAGAKLLLNHLSQGAGYAQNSASDQFRNLNAGESDSRAVAGYDQKWNWINYFAVARYKLKDRYMATFTLSMDGSSRFGKDVTDGIEFFHHPFAVLPSMGLAWRISGEPFMRNIPFLDELKVRFSYGLSGSDDMGDYVSKSYYVSVPYYAVTGYVMGGITNPDIKWETYKKRNAGVDIALFKERIMLTADFFHDRTDNMISYIALPTYYGYSTMTANSGSCQNTGTDLTLFVRVIDRQVKWDIDLACSSYKNKIRSIDKGSIITSFTGGEKISMKGHPFGMFYGYKSLGVFSTQTEADEANLVDDVGRRFNAGDMHFADLDGNHVINEADKTIIGNPHPDFTGGFGSTVTFRGISVNAQFSFVKGNDVFNYMRYITEAMGGFENQSTAVYNRWVEEGQKTAVPKASYGDPIGNSRFSSRWIEDGSFLRLRNLTVSYTYPKNLFFIRSLTIYSTATNLITWTRYLGYDPEFSYADGALEQGIDYGKLPQCRSFVVGLKVGL